MRRPELEGARQSACSPLVICACLGRRRRGAAQSAKLQVSLNPKRLGASTTIAFGFQIEDRRRGAAPALTQLDVRLPAGMGVDTSGLATCTRSQAGTRPAGLLEKRTGGTGSVKVQVPLGNVTRPEIAALTVFNGPRKGGRTTLVFDAIGKLPIATQLIFTGVIVPGPLGRVDRSRDSADPDPSRTPPTPRSWK